MFKNSVSVVLLGPSLAAVSGVSTHLNQLLGSELAQSFQMLHFQVGSEGRKENAVQKIARLILSPLVFLFFLLKHRPGIVHINTSMAPRSYWRDIAYLLIARILKCRVVYQVHGGVLPEDFFAYSRALTGLLRWVLMQPDVVVLLARVEFDAYRCFVPGQRLEVVANAIDARTLAAEPLSAKPRGPLHLVYLGRLAESKGIFEILAALAALVGQGRDLRLSIGGSGPDEARLRAQVVELGLLDRVVFAGTVFGTDKDRLWRKGHVFVFPTYHEGLPYSLLEAMAAGAVPITTRVGAISDVIQDEVHGLFVAEKAPAALAGAIARLDDDRVLLARLAEAGRARVLSEYTVARLAEDFAHIYESLTA